MFSKSNKAFGLDISDNSLRLIQLKKCRKKGLIVNAWAETPLKPGWLADGEVKDAKNLTQAIKKFCRKTGNGKLLSREVVVCLPETKTFIKLLTLPLTTPEEIPKALNKEIPEHIPLDLKNLYFDWQVIEKRTKEMDILIGVAPKKIVEDYTNILLEAELFPQALEIEAVAISRALGAPGPLQAILDFGATRSSLIVRDSKTILFSVSIPFSGTVISKVIAQNLKLDSKKAEELKMKCGLDPQKCPENLHTVLLKNLEQLTSRIKAALKFYENHFRQTQPITKLLLCGGGSNLVGLNEYLKKNLGLEIEKVDPFAKIKPSEKIKPLPPEKGMGFVTALGLAMRACPKGLSSPKPKPQPKTKKPLGKKTVTVPAPKKQPDQKTNPKIIPPKASTVTPPQTKSANQVNPIKSLKSARLSANQPPNQRKSASTIKK